MRTITIWPMRTMEVAVVKSKCIWRYLSMSELLTLLALPRSYEAAYEEPEV